MKDFFDNIENKKQINFDRFIKKFAEKNVDISSMFKATMIKKPYYILEPKNIETYNSLKSRFYVVADKSTRLGHTSVGNSHGVKSSYALLNVKPSLNEDPVALMFKGNLITNSNIPEFKKKVVIIENMENFGNIAANFKHLKIELNEFSFIFGSGDSITNTNFTRFLKSFDEVLCLFDIDKGGFSMFKIIEKKHDNCQFIYPDNIDDYFKKSLRILSNEDVMEIFNIFGNNNKLHQILEKIDIYKTIIEQELYLVEDFDDV